MIELQQLGWKPIFQNALFEYAENLTPVRVIEVHRSGLRVAPALAGFEELPLGGRWFQYAVPDRPTVGDWLLVDASNGSIEVVLPRLSEIKRVSPGGDVQMIAANIDTGFVVTSANNDFNPGRIERYLSVLLEANIQPVVVLTKVDLVADVDGFVEAVRAIQNDVPIETVNAHDSEQLQGLVDWAGVGQSIALLGSSGVGKSTLVNTLLGGVVQDTQAVREGDDKGRHTTTHRSLHCLPSGGVILDSPGMREFQITDVDSGVSHVFDDIESLALQCRFNDCQHSQEPGCAILAAIEAGELDSARLKRYFKLKREDRINTETTAERHARSRQFSREVKTHLANNPKLNRNNSGN